MCGIVGIFNVDGSPASVVTLRAMTDAIAHRGPDGEGFYVDSFVGLGHRRLAIIDLSAAGHQPMATSDESLIIAYNGEVYNFHEIRVHLEALGHQFRSRTDTEVVLAAYKEWGAECLSRLNGMFAFVIWDKRHQRLFVARDRYGVKPMYYACIGSTILFASEIKAFLKHPKFEVRLSHRHLLEYFTFQNIFTDGTLFEGVHLLPAGTFATVDLGTRDVRVQRYWDFCFSEPNTPPIDEREYREELDRLFRQAVQRQLVADVSVGSYLSGGMDSGSITAIASQHLPHLCTFTGGFDLTSAAGLELGFDERRKAEALSYRFGTEHYEVVLKSGDMQRCLHELVWHLEDPRVGQSYPNYYVARLASKFVKVVLSGAGGDELFAGYPWRYYRAINGSDMADFNGYVERYYTFWHRLIPNKTISEFFTAPVRKSIDGLRTIDIFREVLEGADGVPSNVEDYVNRSLYFEAKTFLNGLLVVEDKLSMAHSLESRVPFLDNDLVDFAQRVPVRLKLSDLEHVTKINENDPAIAKFTEKTRDGKMILRRVMESYVPAEVTGQVKQGFSGPDASWFRGESIEYFNKLFDSKKARVYEFLDRATVRSLVDDHMTGRANRRLLLWSLLMVEKWCEIFLEGAV